MSTLPENVRQAGRRGVLAARFALALHRPADDTATERRHQEAQRALARATTKARTS